MANPFESDRQKSRDQQNDSQAEQSGLSSVDILREDKNSDKKLKLPAANTRTGEKPIGTAIIQSDETIVLKITGKTGSTIGEAEIEYRRGDKQYDEVLKHIGGIKKGETKIVPPWQDSPNKKGADRATIDGGTLPDSTGGEKKPELKPGEMPVEKPGEMPVEKPVEKPVDTTVEKPGDEQGGKTLDKPKDKPADSQSDGTDTTGTGAGADAVVAPSAQFLAEVTTTYDKMSMETRDVIEKEGTVISPVRRLTDALPELKGQKPRGWPPGLTWDAVDGAYSPSRNMVVVAEETQKGTNTWVKSTRTEDITRHEVGHAVDYGMGKLSSSKDFSAAYDEDIKNMPVALQPALEYFRQSGDGGKEEACAEGIASREGGSTSGSAFDSGFARTIKAIDDALLARRSKMTVQPGVTTSPIIQPSIEQKDLPKTPETTVSPRPPVFRGK